jgi:DNA-binding GntR family transcriptional regulator
MGTSAGPVREAFASLSQEGLLLSLPRRGTFVSRVSELDVEVAYKLRARVEAYAAELALRHLTPDTVAELRDDIVRMRAAAKDGDIAGHSAADMAFHGRLYTLAGSEILTGLWASISSTIRQFVTLAAPHYVDDLREIVEHHNTLADLLEAGDIEGLRREIPTHMSGLLSRIDRSQAQAIRATGIEPRGSAAEVGPATSRSETTGDPNR